MNRPQRLYRSARSTPKLLLAMGIWLGLAGALFSQVAPSPTIAKVEALSDQAKDGLQGIAIRFELLPNAAIPANAIPFYSLECRAIAENGMPLPAAMGAVGYRDRLGDCRDSMALAAVVSDGDKHVMFIPYLALGLPDGDNHIKLQVKLWDNRTHTVVATSEEAHLRFKKPPMKLYRLQVKRIESYTTDSDGETWDYKFLNARDIYPELIWSLRRGYFEAFESPKQKNDTVYIGAAGDLSPWLWLSQGDRIHFYVRDFDLLGYSDLVGSTAIDIWGPNFRSGIGQELRFERVKQAQVVHEVVAPPKIAITNYQILENEHVGGVTGTRIQLEYAVDQAVKDAKFILGVHLRSKDSQLTPSKIQILGPGAVPYLQNVVELTAQQSALALFIPHYAIPSDVGAATSVIVEAGMLRDAQPFVLARAERALVESGQPVTDMGFGQWKIGVDSQKGSGGVRFLLEYELPGAYFRDLGNATISLKPVINAAWGLVDNAKLEISGSEANAWTGELLRLTAATRQGTLDLFLPFAACPPTTGAMVDFSTAYSTTLQSDGHDISIGTLQRNSSIALPPLRALQIGLREASVVRRQWLLSHPSMYWELIVGGKVLHRSKIDPDQRTAHWADGDIHQWVVASSDQLELRVYNKVTDGQPDRVLETWTGTVEALPGKEKGTFRLPTTNLKRMLVHLEYANEKRGGEGSGGLRQQR